MMINKLSTFLHAEYLNVEIVFKLIYHIFKESIK